MGLDEQDAKYLAKLAEKYIAEVGDTYPAKQLGESDYAKFGGVNLQGHAIVKPEEDEDTIALYIIDVDQKLSKRFRVSAALIMLMMRDTARLIYGTTDPVGKQTKIILQWEKEKRMKGKQ